MFHTKTLRFHLLLSATLHRSIVKSETKEKKQASIINQYQITITSIWNFTNDFTDQTKSDSKDNEKVYRFEALAYPDSDDPSSRSLRDSR